MSRRPRWWLAAAAAAVAAAALVPATLGGAAPAPMASAPAAPGRAAPGPATPLPSAAAPASAPPSSAGSPPASSSPVATTAAAHGTPAPFVQSFAAQPGVRPQPALPSPTTTRSMPAGLDGCDHGYGTRTQCVPWTFPPGVTDKCAWLAAHGFTRLTVTGADRHRLDPDGNGVACDGRAARRTGMMRGWPPTPRTWPSGSTAPPPTSTRTSRIPPP